jgi:glucose-6-phosphate isomerase
VIALATGKPDANPNRRFPGNRPSTVILGQRLTPRVLGRLLALYENKVAYQGFLWGINSFDQEGVELGKVVAKRVLPLLTSGAAPAPSGAPESIETALLRAARILPR